LRVSLNMVGSVAAAIAIWISGVQIGNCQSLSGVTIGSDRAALQILGVQPQTSQTLGPHTAMKFQLPGGNSLSATFLRSSGRIVYIENDWGGEPGGSFANFEGLKYGQTSLSAIRTALGSNGFAYAARGLVNPAPDGGLLFFNSYEVKDAGVVVTFVTKASTTDIALLKAQYGEKELANHIADKAYLMAELLAEPDYANTIWGSSKVFDRGYLPIAWGQTKSVTVAEDPKPKELPSPSAYKIGTIYKGKVTLPNFAGRDQKFRSYRTRIRDGMASGPGFAGKMAVVQIGCGTGCSFVLTADTSTGQVFDFPRGGEENMYLSLAYQIDSTLLTAQWASYDQSKCFIEFFNWTNSHWVELGKHEVGPIDSCYNDIKPNLQNISSSSQR
jgi:hypothetical protein